MMMRFLLYGLLGLCMEVFFTGALSLTEGDFALSARTSVWMFPIYACALFLEPVHNLIRPFPPYARGLIYLVLIWAAEFVSGFVLERLIGHCPWDYGTHSRFSFCGYIRWDFAPLWFAVGLLFEMLHDFLVILFP